MGKKRRRPTLSQEEGEGALNNSKAPVDVSASQPTHLVIMRTTEDPNLTRQHENFTWELK